MNWAVLFRSVDVSQILVNNQSTQMRSVQLIDSVNFQLPGVTQLLGMNCVESQTQGVSILKDLNFAGQVSQFMGLVVIPLFATN